jgi:hypothetical protein
MKIRLLHPRQEAIMHALLSFLLLIGFCVLLLGGLVSVLQDLTQRIHGTEQRARSQSVWQSRSRFPGPD